MLVALGPVAAGASLAPFIAFVIGAGCDVVSCHYAGCRYTTCYLINSCCYETSSCSLCRNKL